MTPARRAALEALCEAATPGPWVHFHTAAPKRSYAQDVNSVMCGGREIVAWSGFDAADSTEKQRKANAAFIAAARTALPEALAEVDRLMAAAEVAAEHRREIAAERAKVRELLITIGYWANAAGALAAQDPSDDEAHAQSGAFMRVQQKAAALGLTGEEPA